MTGIYWVSYPWWARLLQRVAKWCERRASKAARYTPATGYFK